jgi:hypothetical protein
MIDIEQDSSSTNWIQNVKEDKDEGAAKHDDASVPISFWNDALSRKLNRCLSHQEMEAITKLRDWSVSVIWKRSVTRCFCNWLRCKDCHNKRLNRLFDSRTNKEKLEFRCERCKSLLEEKNKIVEHTHVLKGNKKRLCYNWTKEGRKQYKNWFNKYMRKHTSSSPDVKQSVGAAKDCITRASHASTWGWDDGSRPFFWRWGDEYWKESRDGTKIWIKDKLPKYSKKQRVSKDKHTRMKEQEKVQKVRGR